MEKSESDLEREIDNFDWIRKNIDNIRSVVKSDDRYFAIDNGEILDISDDAEVLHDKYKSPVVILSLSDYLGVVKIVNGE